MSRAPQTLVLDAGALIAVERDVPAARRAIGRAVAAGGSIVIPSSVVAQAWRDGSRQARVARLVSAAEIAVLDGAAARAVGRLLARSGTRDVVDGHVALCALESSAVVMTSDPRDLARVLPGGALLVV